MLALANAVAFALAKAAAPLPDSSAISCAKLTFSASNNASFVFA